MEGVSGHDIEDVVVTPRRFATEILQQIEVGSSAVVEADQFSIHDRAIGQIGERLDHVGKLSIQRLLSAREEDYTTAGPDCERSIAIKYRDKSRLEMSPHPLRHENN
jgi:hypothetical protein